MYKYLHTVQYMGYFSISLVEEKYEFLDKWQLSFHETFRCMLYTQWNDVSVYTTFY